MQWRGHKVVGPLNMKNISIPRVDLTSCSHFKTADHQTLMPMACPGFSYSSGPHVKPSHRLDNLFAARCTRRQFRVIRNFVPKFQVFRMSSLPPSRVAVVEIGMGTDLHGQNATKAAVRACRNAIEFNSLPGLGRILPDSDYNNMKIHVKLGIPEPFENDVDVVSVKSQFPYGTVSVEVVSGGLLCSSGVVLKEQGDGEEDDRAIVAIAAVSVIC